jgi:MFS family permease
MDISNPPSRLYSRPFLLLCLSHALFAGSFNMMIPELPAYLSQMGGAEHKGLIIALFTVTAGISRPFSGKLADTVGRLPVMYIGTLVCVVCSLCYPLLPFVSGFFVLRFLHGFSTGFKPTGTSAYVADIVPDARRGEAMGALGICLNLGASSTPPLGSYLSQSFGINTMFMASAAFALLSILILLNLRETLPNKQQFQWQLLRVGREDIYDPAAMPSAIVMICCYVSYGVLLTLVPDLSDHLGVQNRGTFFTIFTLSSLLTRFAAGRISDIRGRVPVLQASCVLLAASMLLFAHATSAPMLYAAAAMFGLGNGVFSPAINAWTIDLGDPQRKGRAMATMYIALEIAIGGGAFFGGLYYANDFGRMPGVFYTAAAACLIGLGYLVWWKRGAR